MTSFTNPIGCIRTINDNTAAIRAKNGGRLDAWVLTFDIQWSRLFHAAADNCTLPHQIAPVGEGMSWMVRDS